MLRLRYDNNWWFSTKFFDILLYEKDFSMESYGSFGVVCGPNWRKLKVRQWRNKGRRKKRANKVLQDSWAFMPTGYLFCFLKVINAISSCDFYITVLHKILRFYPYKNLLNKHSF